MKIRFGVAAFAPLLLAACTKTNAPVPSAALKGSVVIAGTTTPLVKMMVTAIGPTPATTVTDGEGRYAFTSLVPGLYRVCVVAPSTAEGELCTRAEIVDADSIAPVLTPTPLGAVSGRIVDADGAALGEVWVGAAGETPIAITDREGNFLLRGLIAGTRQLYAVKSGYQPLVARTVEIAWQDTRTLGEVTLAAETQPLTNLAATVEIVAASGDETIEVTIDPIARHLSCDASGHFETLLPAGVYALTITAPRRRLLLPRVLVGDGRAYIVQNDFRALDTVVLPLGEQQTGRASGTRTELDGSRLVQQVDRGVQGSGRFVEIWSMPDHVLRYQHALQKGLAGWTTRNGRLYCAAPTAQGAVDLLSIDLATYEETIAVPSLATVSFLYGDSNPMPLFWTQDGALYNVDNGQQIYQAAPALANLPVIARIDEKHFALRFVDRFEGRRLTDGGLVRTYVTADPNTRLYVVGDRWFVLDGTGLFALAEDGALTPIAMGRLEVAVVGDQLLYSPYLGISNWKKTLYRPSDGRTRTWNEVFIAAPLVFVSDDGLAYSVRQLDDLDHELQLVPFGMPQRAQDPRYVLLGNGKTELGAHWIALEIATGAVIDLGFGRGATQTAPPSVVDGRFFVIDDVFGNGSPGTLRERFADGTSRALAASVYWFAISPHAARVAFERLGVDDREMVAQSIDASADTAPEIFARGGVQLSWLRDDLLAWRSDPPFQASHQEPGDYLTSFPE